MAGPFRGYRQADVDSSQLGEDLKKTLTLMSNHDPFMRSLLGRRERSRMNSDRQRIQREEREKIAAEARASFAVEVREEVKGEVFEELKPDLQKIEEERDKLQMELQVQFDEIEAEKQGVKELRKQAREDAAAEVRREMAVTAIGLGAGVSAGVGEVGFEPEDTADVAIEEVAEEAVAAVLETGGVGDGAVVEGIQTESGAVSEVAESLEIARRVAGARELVGVGVASGRGVSGVEENGNVALDESNLEGVISRLGGTRGGRGGFKDGPENGSAVDVSAFLDDGGDVDFGAGEANVVVEDVGRGVESGLVDGHAGVEGVGMSGRGEGVVEGYVALERGKARLVRGCRQRVYRDW